MQKHIILLIFNTLPKLVLGSVLTCINELIPNIVSIENDKHFCKTTFYAYMLNVYIIWKLFSSSFT